MLILKRPWTQQPQRQVHLRDRWSADVAAVISGANSAFTTDGQQITTVGAVTKTVKQPGLMSSHTAGASPTVLRARIPNSTIGTDGRGAAFLVQFTSISTVTSLYIAGFGSDSGSGGNTLFAIQQGATPSQLRVVVGNSTTNTARELAGGPVINDGNVHTALVSLDNFNTSGSCTYQIFMDGKFLVEQTDAVVLGASNIYSWCCAGSVVRVADLAIGATCQISLAVPFRRRVTRNEGERLTQNPWLELFAPQQIKIPTAAAAASSLPTLSASTYVPGSITATGVTGRVTATEA